MYQVLWTLHTFVPRFCSFQNTVDQQSEEVEPQHESSVYGHKQSGAGPWQEVTSSDVVAAHKIGLIPRLQKDFYEPRGAHANQTRCLSPNCSAASRLRVKLSDHLFLQLCPIVTSKKGTSLTSVSSLLLGKRSVLSFPSLDALHGGRLKNGRKQEQETHDTP